MKKTLLQLDTDSRPSTFDSMVAIDSGIDFLVSHHDVNEDNIETIVHGAMFTRGPDDLHNTAIFIGGTDVSLGEKILQKVSNCFFGPIRVSAMLDSNGCNTTAAAAVVCAMKHLDAPGSDALILAGTGPVGMRTARILAMMGTNVTISSRTQEKADQCANLVASQLDQARAHLVRGCSISSTEDLSRILPGKQLVIATGAAGVCLWPKELPLNSNEDLRVAIDLNAVGPHGIEAIQVTDKSVQNDGVVCYGAIGVGGLKMKTHKKAVDQLFQSNDKILDVVEIFEIAQQANI